NLIDNFPVQEGEKNKAGIYKAHISIKVSALSADFKPEAEDYVYQNMVSRLKKILLAAKFRKVFINIDAEHYNSRGLIFNICRRLLLNTPELKKYEGIGMVLQAYLRDAAHSLNQILQLAKERNVVMPLRLVKGAYWDAETIEAHAHGFDAPQFLNKEETDLNFRQLIISIFQKWPHVQLCLASHNFSDHCYAVRLKDRYFPDLPPIEHQCLHMTYEALSTGMSELGWVVRNYIPIGNLLVGMAYLVRRIMENSSQTGVLQIMLSHKKKKQLESPEIRHRQNIENHVLKKDHVLTSSSGFHHASPVRLYLEDHKKWMDRALLMAGKELNKEYANSFNGDNSSVTSPSNPNCVVGKIRLASLEDAKNAVEKSLLAYKQWASCWKTRVSILIRAADLMLLKRLELASLICHEGGKTISESLADVDEAIDFLNFYAREEKRLQEQPIPPLSRGVTAVISPWNFPLAIPCGMTASSLATGNTVILKSAKQTPLIAQKMTDIFHQAGMPQDVLIHLPGDGRVIGEYLISHSQITAVIFTGSKKVGMRIAHLAGKRIVKTSSGYSSPVKIITEMGGKNAIIITANAEPDETVAGILSSAFAHAGQKCSACSRILVDNRIKDYLVKRLTQACGDLQVGEAFAYSTFINPVISEQEKQRL
ncbi:MAG: bifunctional proline dehydrogenase/L-glutamate gamma-semialdehyde dehydrogenase, partial [Halobacteriovoraceae bacterium]|nr:bifunctional proline dehydrogenase/L-glutamate gamma-semialdehyde dehydrogenase [Halobacteriovoraceae bacterium]